MKNVEAVLAALGNAACRRDIISAGISQHALLTAVRAGAIHAVARGVYALPAATGMELHLAKNHVVPGCISAAVALGLWTISVPAQPHVAAAHGRKVVGCVVHRHAGPLTVTDIVGQCVRCLPEVEALVVMESAVVLRKCSLGQLRLAFEGRGASTARRIMDTLDPQSMSAVETSARYWLRRAGYNVQAQYAVRGMGHLDLMIDGVLGIEIESEQYHNNAAAFAEDLRRGNVLVIRGIPTLRIGGSIALWKPELMLKSVAQALETIKAAHR
ncbi:hypothetical protein IV500_02560 [Paeniglutamicibacter antarcticus]|uniref:DUF559 domain-containing protein n=1 Tax=Arthrobacter terrae TaxID=2935737 RepID=A0A931G6H4_9MICC|nr:type IV toxin-antitoxin system AbiEi family antitoxin domain-containing protein [Arthrobacter terrae]MBG0738314.1 hypothetical protein [Arthrobacter terrae]